MFSVNPGKKSKRLTFQISLVSLAVLFILVIGPQLLELEGSQALAKKKRGGRYCTQTAEAAFDACVYELKDDYNIAIGNCTNLEDFAERKECLEEARDAAKEAREECKEQFWARRDVCDLVGEDRYDPDFGPDDGFATTIEDIVGNTYFPLEPGNFWRYEGAGEIITVEVKEKTKLIEGVTCIVVNDVVTDEDGVKIEDTDDWYAQDLVTNDVWYCGEIARNYELFEDDDPEEPELVDIDGSWKAGRDGAKPGILMLAGPAVGDAYRQEMLLGDAEDVAEVLSTTYSYSGPTDDSGNLDYLVPADLANALCSAANCVVTLDLTALEPGVEERKYYAPGIGVFLEVNLETEEVVQLVECNVADNCPTPAQ